LTWQLIYLTQIKDVIKINEIRNSALMSTDGNAEPNRRKIVSQKQLFCVMQAAAFNIQLYLKES
jgi:hypothetical protein